MVYLAVFIQRLGITFVSLKNVALFGLRRMEELNKALVAKLGWEMAVNRGSFWVEALTAKYCRGRQFLAAPNQSRASWIWQGILQTREIVQAGLYWCIQEGKDVNIWCDPWVHDLPDFIPLLKQDVVVNSFINRIQDLIDPSSFTWRARLIRHLFEPISAKAILNLTS
ncbi:hypothetical protein CJ030_MR1G002460 [Morella rubra]|uniref:Uncharacterized protein n=1 Tax=Morella rubra TaxID=262757 RepID=A0A6A1WK09_9ROSI|nr:hypothetical protein CJ030_MR1G002460 [Morella rubra]